MKLTWKHFINFPFIFELFLYAFSLYLAIGISLNLIRQAPIQQFVSQSNDYSAFNFILLFIIATVALLLILKFFKKPWLIKILFYIAILQGLWIFTQAYFNWPLNLIIFIILILYWLVYQNILIHDVVIVLAVSAIAVVFGLNLMPSTAILILLFLAVYDFWAVYKTKHMVKMFKKLSKHKVHFALIIPPNFDGLYKPIKFANPEDEFMFLGTGDVALPAILVVASLKISLLASIFTALGAVGGLIGLYIVFMSQAKRQPMPGLPLIVLGTLIGFLISFAF